MRHVISRLFGLTTATVTSRVERRSNGRPVDAGTTIEVSHGVMSGQVLGCCLCVKYDQTVGRWNWYADDGLHRPMFGKGYDSWDKAWWDGVQSIEDWVFDG